MGYVVWVDEAEYKLYRLNTASGQGKKERAKGEMIKIEIGRYAVTTMLRLAAP